MAAAKKSNTTKKILIAGAIVLLIGGGIYLYLKNRNKKDEGEVLQDTFDNLNFEFNKATILESSFPYLDKLADIMNKKPKWKLQIVGHTDNVGNDAYNLDLSQRRANQVKKYLEFKKVNPSQITATGLGETKPVADNSTKEGRDKNRRVEFTIIKEDNSISTTTL